MGFVTVATCLKYNFPWFSNGGYDKTPKIIMFFRKKKKINSLGLSSKSLQLATEKPDHWEYLLFAQVIGDGVEANKKNFQNSSFSSTTLAEKIEFDRILVWVSESFDDCERIMAELDSLMNSNHEKAFGPPGTPGNVEAIVALSYKIIGYYYQAMSWSQNVIHTPIDSRLAEIPSELAKMSTSITAGIEQFSPNLLKQLEIAITAPPNAPPQEVTITIGVEPSHMNQLLLSIQEIIEQEIIEIEKTNEQTNYKAGFIYLFENPSMEGLVKIGKTKKDPHERAKELGGATGVPTPFSVVFYQFVDDCDEAERYVHKQLEKYRESSSREFFRVSTNDAIHIMVDAKNHVDKQKI